MKTKVFLNRLFPFDGVVLALPFAIWGIVEWFMLIIRTESVLLLAITAVAALIGWVIYPD